MIWLTGATAILALLGLCCGAPTTLPLVPGCDVGARLVAGGRGVFFAAGFFVAGAGFLGFVTVVFAAAAVAAFVDGLGAVLAGALLCVFTTGASSAFSSSKSLYSSSSDSAMLLWEVLDRGHNGC